MESLPNSGEPRDRQSASNRDAQLPAALARQSVATPEWQEPVIPDFEALIKRHRNFAGVFREFFEPLYPQIPRFAQGPTPEADRARFERIFRPWPKWALRISAELWHVRYPTIERERFFQTFRVLNAVFFRCLPDPDVSRSPASMRDVCDRVDMRVLPMVFAKFYGHAFEHLKADRKTLDERLAAGKIAPEEYAQAIRWTSPEYLEKSLRSSFAQWAKDEDLMPFDLIRTVEDARHKTFDKHGQRKETPLVPIYQEIFNNWIKVESMTGPKELTEFLSPHLGNQDFEAKYERVKAICKRMRIRFRPSVKGRRSIPSASLHG